MSLGLRISLAISLLVVLLSVGLSVAVRRSWESVEQRQFAEQVDTAIARLRAQLDEEVAELPKKLQPLCDHGEMVNSALVDLEGGRGRIPRDREYPLSTLASETQKSFGFDEFILFTNTGKVLGAHQAKLIGSTSAELGLVQKSSQTARLDFVDGQAQLSAHCIKFSGKYGVGVYAARHFASILDQVSQLHGLTLSLSAPLEPSGARTFELQQLPGAQIYASPKRDALRAAITQLNQTMLQWGALSLVIALLLSFLFARRLARPIEELSEQASRVVTGDPVPIKARGGKELKQLARSFNQAISDLAELRKRLTLIERIAAQREIARRVAHEIKNPLAPIRAAVETLRRLRRRNDPAFDEYFEEASATVLNEVARITNIVKEFTEFARLPQPKPERLDAAELLRSIVNLHRTEGVQLSLECDGALWINADRDQLVQVATNLIQNALDAVAQTPDARISVQAHIAQERQQFVLMIADNGPGVPEEVRQRLFSPYVTSKPDGTGLGLSIVQRIVVEHDGEIEHASSQRGAEFVVRLPVDGPMAVLEAPDSTRAR